MPKAYIHSWKEREAPEESRLDYFIAPDAEKACGWDTKEEAERSCRVFDGHRIKVQLANGAEYVCCGFKVEQRATNSFVVFCGLPSALEAPSHNTHLG
jgi:hypothetical protein